MLPAGLTTGRSCATMLDREHVLHSNFSVGRLLLFEQQKGRNVGSHGFA